MMKIFHVFSTVSETVKGFISDECGYKSSSLTFYTLLSIVPILSMALGIAKGIGLEQYLEAELKVRLLDQPEMAHQIISFAYSMLDQVHGGWLALLGLIGFLWTSLQLFGNIEYAFNAIFKTQSSKSYFRQYMEYFFMLILGSLFFIISSSLAVMTMVQLNLVSQEYAWVDFLSPYLKQLLKSFPFVVNGLLFTLIYKYFINVKISWLNTLLGGIVAGSAYQCLEWIYLYFQIGVASYGAVYGSFAALPLFLVWVNWSWSIVLAGAELIHQLEARKQEVA